MAWSYENRPHQLTRKDVMSNQENLPQDSIYRPGIQKQVANANPNQAVLSVDEILEKVALSHGCLDDYGNEWEEQLEAIQEAKAQLATYLTNAFERVITKSERVYLYGSEKQLAMDEGEQFENDLAMARNALRAEQRVIAKQIIEELNK